MDDDNSDDESDIDSNINSSDLEGMDSNSDSETFQNIVQQLNESFRRRIDNLLNQIKKKIEKEEGENGNNGENNEEDGFINFARRMNWFLKKRISQQVKEEVEERTKKREVKADQKQNEWVILDDEFRVDELPKTNNVQVKEIESGSRQQPQKKKKEKLSNVFDDYFYKSMREGNSESSSPKSSQSPKNIKQEEQPAKSQAENPFKEKLLL